MLKSILQSLDAGLKISFCRQQIFLLLESDSVKSFLSLDEEFEVFFSSVAAAYYRNLPARPDLVLKVVNDPLRCFPTRYGTGWGVADTNGLKACFGVGFAGVGSISWTTAIESYKSSARVPIKLFSPSNEREMKYSYQ